MLNNLSIRDRLTLILLGPLVVLLAIAALAVRENLTTSSDTNDAAFRVEMAQVNSRLFEAVRQEAAANQKAVALTTVDLTDVRSETDAAGALWLDRITRFRDLDVDGLEADIRDLGDKREAASGFYGTGAAGAEAVYEADIALLGEIAAFDGRLNGRGESASASGLLKASQLTDAAFATADAQLLGLWAAYSGTVPSAALATQIEASEAALRAYGNRAQADEQVPDDSDAYADLSATFSQLVVGDDVSIDADAWADASESRAAAIEETKGLLLLKTGGAVNDEAATARATMRNVGLLALAGLLVGAAILFFVVRSIRGSLGAINAEATTLAKSDLPKLAASLAAGQPVGSHEERPLLDTSGNDEIAEVAESLNEIRRSASTVAQQQTDLLQSGIAEMFVNLARRNQSLVDRQLEVIDDLEAQERDADRLAHLYRVDHLATRMRRNAESLLVLADNTTPRRRGEPVDLREVVRVAIGEVEDYRRIVPIALEELPVAAHVAHDIAHLLSELMENATQSSPPGTVADVVGVTEPDGSYTIHVMDRGTGIDNDRRAQLNRILEEPPTNNLTMSKTLGLTVVGRLARRMGIAVTLNPGTEGGTVASVSIPADVVAEWSRTGRKEYAPLAGPASPAAPAPAEAAAAPVAPTVEPEPMPAPVEAPLPVEPPIADPVSMDLSALQELAPLPTSEIDSIVPPDQVAQEDDISGLPPFPTLGPPNAEPVAPPVSDLPGDDVFGMHEPIPQGETAYAPPPSASDVFGGPSVDSATEPTIEAGEAQPVEPVLFDDEAHEPTASVPDPMAAVPVEPMQPPAATVPPEAVFTDDVPSVADDVPPVADDVPPVADDPVGASDSGPGEVFTLPVDAAEAPDAPAESEAAIVDVDPGSADDDPFADLLPTPGPVAPTQPPPDLSSPPIPPMPSMPAHAAPGPDPLTMPAPPAEQMPTIPAHAASMPSPFETPPSPPTPEPAPPTLEPVPPTLEPTLEPAYGAPPVPSVGEVAPSPETTTPAGLVKRKRGAASLPDVTGPSGDRTAPSKRSPDQVKNMLSRYKTGLERGRTDTEGKGQS